MARWRAPRFLSSTRGFLFARLHLRFIVGLLAGIALGGARLDLRLGLPDRCQTFFTTRQFLRDAHALGQRLGIGGLGASEHFLDFGFQLRLDLLRMPVGQRAMARGVGVNLGAIECDGAQFEQLHLPGNDQHLHEQCLDLFEKALAEGAQRIMIRLRVGGNIAKGDRIVRRRLNAPARIHARGVAIDEQAQHHCRMIGGGTGPTVLPGQRREIELIDDIDYEARQVILGQPILHRGWQQKRRGAIDRTEIDHSNKLGSVKTG